MISFKDLLIFSSPLLILSRSLILLTRDCFSSKDTEGESSASNVSTVVLNEGLELRDSIISSLVEYLY